MDVGSGVGDGDVVVGIFVVGVGVFFGEYVDDLEWYVFDEDVVVDWVGVVE